MYFTSVWTLPECVIVARPRHLTVHNHVGLATKVVDNLQLVNENLTVTIEELCYSDGPYPHGEAVGSKCARLHRQRN
jgi:hypothetical protein